MARPGDALGYYYEEGYIEAGYYEYEPYIEEGYIDATYFQEEGAILQASAALTLSSTVLATVGVIKQGVCALSGVFTPSIFAVASRNGSIDMAAQIVFAASANANRSADVTLENLVNLSLQAARIRDNAIALAAAFAATSTANRTRDYSSSLAVSTEQSTTGTRIKQLSASLEGVFTPGIVAVASRNGSTDMAATATATATGTKILQLGSDPAAVTSISATVGYLRSADADLSTNIAVAANAIEYILEPLNFGRPNNMVGYNYSTARPLATRWQIDNSAYNYIDNNIASFYLDYNLRLQEPAQFAETVAVASNFDSINLGTQDFYIFFFHKQNDIRETINDSTILSVGQGFNTVFDISGQPRYVIMDNTINIGYERVSGGFLERPTARIRKADGSYITLNDPSGAGDRSEISASMRLLRQGNQFEFYYGNSLVASETYSGQLYSNVSQLTLYNPEGNSLELSESNSPIFDQVTFRVGDTGPFRNPGNAETTVLYHQFEQTLDDSTSGTLRYYSANLNSTASITASLGGTFGADAQLSTTAALNAVVSSIEQNSAELSTAATLTAQATRIVQAESDLNGVFEQTASSGAIRRTAIAIQSLFTQNASINLIASTSTSLTVNGTINSEITRIKQLSAQLDAFYSALTVAAKVGDFFVDADVQATVAVTATATRDATATGAVSTLLAAQAVRIQQLSSSLSSTADLACTANLEIGAISALNTSSAVECSATIITDAVAAFNTQATVDCTATGFVGTLNNQFFTTATVDCDAGLIKPLSADLVAVDARVGASPTRIKQLDALIEGVFSPTISAVVSRNGSVDLAANSNIQIVNSRIRAQSADISVTTTAAATAGIIKGSAVLIAAATASVAVQAVVQASAAAEFTVAATVDALGIKAIEASAELNGVFSPTIVAVASRAGDFDLAASSTLAAQAVVIADSTAVFTVDCEQISSATLIKQLEAQLSMAVALTATSGLLKQTTADLNCTLQIQASGGFVDLLRFVYVVPKETRTHTIHQETKVHTVHKEQRIYTLGAP